MKTRLLALFVCLCTLLSLFPSTVFAAKSDQVQTILATDAELSSTAAALKTEIASLADGKNRNGRVRLSGFTQSTDGSTDMRNIKGKHYLIRNQNGVFYALNGAWTGSDGNLPTVSVTASDTTNFYYIASGISTTHAFNLVPAGKASNGMPAYYLQFNNGNYMGIGTRYTGSYTNLYYVKSSTSKYSLRFEHSNGAGNFGIRNATGTHGLRQNNDITVYRWKDNSAGDNAYTGNVLYLYRLWSTSDLRAAINEMTSYLDAPVFYKPDVYQDFLTCLRESIDLFKKYNAVPTAMIDPYDDVQDTLDAKAAALRAFKNQLYLVIDGLSQDETNAATTLYQLPSKKPRDAGDFDHNMSYIIKTRKGKIILIDGGWQAGDYDGKFLFSYLQQITGDPTPHVTAWFFTHAHGDHHGAAGTIAALYPNEITVDAFYHHNPSDEEIATYFTAEDFEGTKAAVRRVRTVMKSLKNAEGGPVREVFVNSLPSGKCNSTFDFDEVHIDILLDMSDVAWYADNNTSVYNGSRELQGRYFKEKTAKQLLTDNFNESSIIFRMTVAGKNVLFTGDAGFVAGQALLRHHNKNASDPETYYNLKTDYVQIAHHGYYGMAKNVYDTIAPSVVLWPTPKYEWEADASVNANMVHTRTWFPNAKSYISYTGPQSFSFPVIRSATAVSIPAALKPYVFDAKYYADNNADLKNAYGYDEAKLYKHFINFGIEEGRCASPFFDVKFYMNQNGQNFLYTMKGDYEKAFKHFLSSYTGTTLKKLSPIFDPTVYVTMHTDLADSTQFALLQHYAANDYIKNRIATTTYPSPDGTTMHNQVILTQAKLPTCTAEGRTARIKCSACSAILQETEPLAMLPHTYDDGTVTLNPTCTAEGVTTFTCTVCEGTKTESIEALGHTPVSDPAVDPSCSQTGLTEGSHCSVCGEVLTAQELIETLPHTYETVVTAPNCTEAGFTTYTCIICGDTYSADEIEANGHTEVIDEAVSPDCTNAGLSEGKHCSVCGEVLVAQTVVDALGHSEVIDMAVAPTCTETGLTEGKHCSVCGEVLVAQTVVDALGHTHVYTDNGEKHTLTCENCDYSAEEDHKFVDGSCTCGAVESTEPIPDENLKFNMDIVAGAEMVVNYNFMAMIVNKYEDFYLEVRKNVAGAEPIVTTYGVSEGHTPMGSMNHPVTGAPLMFNAAYNGINAKEMGDSFATTLYAIDANGKVYKGETVVRSIKDYLLGKLEDTNSIPELKTMAVDMLKYGAVAQVNFNYDTENLVTNALTEEQLALATQKNPDAIDYASVTGTGANVNTNITVNSKVELSLSCIAAGQANPAGVKCVITDSEGKVLAELATANIGGVMYSAKYDNVGARQMREVITATFYNAEGTAISKTVRWSVESYVAQTRARTNATETEIAMVDAMLTYGDSVAAYMTAQETK